MKTNPFGLTIPVAILPLLPLILMSAPAAPSPCDALAAQSFALGAAPSAETQEFTSETRVVSFAPNGELGVTDIYRLRVRHAPAAAGSPAGDTITCLRFSVQLGGGSEVEIPALKGLSYMLDLGPDNGRPGHPMLGVPHAAFENLADAAGRSIPPGNAYHVYNAFIDLHAFCSIFTRPMGNGKGVEALRSIGQKIVHATAFTEAPVDLGSNVAKGSFFRNGEVTLEFKGIGVVDTLPCALLGVDSGRSSFQMTMRPAPTMEMKTTGSSHYKGDIYLNLATQWVDRVDADEMVVTETTLPTPPNKIDSIVERTISIRNVTARRP